MVLHKRGNISSTCGNCSSPGVYNCTRELFCKHPLSAMGCGHSKNGNVNLKVESSLNLKVTIVSGY